MKTFYRDTNNGITVIVSEEDYERRKKEPSFKPTFFTFANSDGRVADEPWLTGSYELMDKLLKDHMVVSASIYVPFSNADLYGKDAREIRAYLQDYSPNLEQVLAAFDVELTYKLGRER